MHSIGMPQRGKAAVVFWFSAAVAKIELGKSEGFLLRIFSWPVNSHYSLVNEPEHAQGYLIAICRWP